MNLVTGGLGFIGNELVRQLRSRNEKVVIVDNYNRTAPMIDDISDVPVFKVDITEKEKLFDVFRKFRPKIVFHLAAIHFIPECNENPQRTLRVNVEGTQNVLSAAVNSGVEHFIFASSGAVYADSLNHLNENSAVCPVDVYGVSKMAAEQLCDIEASFSGMKVTACRLFNNIGPRETNPHIVPEVIEQLKKSNTLYLGNTSAIRDYITTEETAEAFIRISKCTPGDYRVINIATGVGATVKELIDMIAEIMGRKIKIKSDPKRFRKVDKAVQIGDVKNLYKITEWMPKTSLKKGLLNLLKIEGLIS